MDPEVQQQITEQLNEMSELLRQQNSYMANQVKMMELTSAALNNQTTAMNNSTKTGKDAATSTNNSTKLSEITANANKMQAEAMNRLSDSFSTGKTALLGFTQAMLDVTPGLAKYSESIKQGIDTVGNFASGFGPLGSAASGLLGVFSSLVTASLSYTDAVVKGYDDVAKLGGGIGTSAEQIVEMGRQAGLSSGTLSIFTKNAGSLCPNIRALGATTSDGVKNFGKFIAVGDKTLQQYRKLGYSQEDLVAIQTKYIEQQAVAGADLRKSPQALQKESLKYLDSLTALAELTGVSVKEQQGALDAALAQENFNAYIFKLEQDKAKATTQEEKDRIHQKIEAKKNAAAIAQATMDAESATGFLESISTDGRVIATESNAKLLMNGMAIDDINQSLNQGKDQTGRILGEQVKAVDRFNDSFGDLAESTGKGGRELMSQFGIGNKIRQTAARVSALKSEEEQERYAKELAQKQREINEQKNETDGIVNDRAIIEQEERAARLEFDNLLKILSNKLLKFITFLMPKITTGIEFLAKHFDKIVNVSQVLAVAMGALAAAAAVGKVVSVLGGLGESLKGLFGGKTGPVGSNPMNPMYVKTNDALSDLTGDKPNKGADGKPKKDATGRWRDSKGKYTKAPKNLLSRIGSSAKMLKYGKVLAGGLGSLLGGLALDYGADKAKAAGYAKTGAGLSVGSAALTGAGIGATAGSIIPGVGTVIGGAVGGLIGTGIGLFQNKEALFGSTTSKGSQDSLTKMIDQVQKLQKYEFNKPKVENNSSSLVVFSEIMSSFKGTPESTENASLPAEIAVKFFAVKPPLKEFETFANLNIDPKKASINSKAFIDFVNTMSLYKGGPGIIDTVSSLIGKGLNSLFGPASPVEAFADFAKKDFGPKASANSEAFLKYAQAAGMMSRSGGGGDGGGTAGGGSAGGSAGGGGSAGASGVAQSRLETGVSAGAAAAGGAIAAGGQLAYNAVDWAKAKITGKPTDVLNFTARSGSYENFTALNSDMQKAVVLAATDYKQATGRKMTMNSGLRAAADQERLWAETVKRGTPGKGPTGMKVGRPPSAGGNPPHLRGNAIDLQEAKNDPSRSLPILARYGLKQTYGQKDPVHLDLMKARDGGLFEGPDKGYPSAMKMLSSLDTQSIVMKLAKTPVSTAANEKKKGSMDKNAAAIYSQNSQLTFEIAKKLDQVIDALESDNSVQGKILKHSRA